MRTLLIAMILLLCSPFVRAADIEGPLNRSSDSWTSGLTPPLLISGVACNAAEAARTWTMTAQRGAGYATAAFQLDFTRTAATLVTIQAKASLNSQGSWAVIPACDSTLDGTCALTGDSEFTRDVSGGSDNVMFRVDFNGAPDVRLVITCTGGGASDTFDLYGRVTSR